MVAADGVIEIARKRGFFLCCTGEKGFILHFGESLSDIKGSEVSHDLKQAMGQTRVDGRLPMLALIGNECGHRSRGEKRIRPEESHSGSRADSDAAKVGRLAI
jgi:hypothetical protein